MTKRRAKAVARRDFALPRNYATAKTTVSKAAAILNKGNQFLNATTCISITRGTAIDQRLRDSVVVSGVRIQFAARNLNKYNLFLNWAVISSKGEEAVSSSTNDFFRDYNDDRSWNSGSAAKTGQEWSNAAINLDKYRVHRRGKFLLGKEPGGTAVESTENKESMKEMDIYIKLGRTVTFDDGGTIPFEQLYFVFWGASPLDMAGNNTGAGFTETTKIIVYFREPKSG